MTGVSLRPDLKTASGEVCDIMFGGQYAGTMTLVYRENDRISGSIQLEEDSLGADEKRIVVEFVQDYIRSLIDALNVTACEVPVTYSSFDHIIVSDEEDRLDDRFMDKYAAFPDGPDAEEMDETYAAADYAGTWADDEADLLELDDEDAEALYYELVVVSDRRNRMHYHVYGMDREWVAEAFMKMADFGVAGEIRWLEVPSDEEIAAVTDLIVSDFDEDEVDAFVIHHEYDGEVIETIELTHEDLLDEGPEPADDRMIAAEDGAADEDFSVVLVRDDGDALTYDIYRHSNGGLPIGTATLDIRERQVAGFIDFRRESDADDAETISTLLLRELDKEREYDTVSLTMVHGNEPIDEIVFETEQVH